MSNFNLNRSFENNADCNGDSDSDSDSVYYNVPPLPRPVTVIERSPGPVPLPRRRRTVMVRTAATPPMQRDLSLGDGATYQVSNAMQIENRLDNIDIQDVGDASQVTTEGVKMKTPDKNGELNDLKNCPWYWGDISRSDTEQKLKNCPNGSFLVRNSTTPGDYTLTVRNNGQSKCVKIYQKDGCFGLKLNECSFDSVSALIEHYRQHTLAGFNRTLNTNLTSFPHKKKATGSGNQYESLSTLAGIGRHLQKVKQEYVALKEKQVGYNQTLIAAQLRARALQTARTMFSELLAPPPSRVDAFVMEKDEALSAEKREILEENKMLSKERYQIIWDLSDKAYEETEHIEHLFNNSNIEINDKVEELRDAEENCGVIRTQMIDNGAKIELVDCLLEEYNTASTDRSLWLVNCSRDEAVEHLQNESAGTFLIRPKDELLKPYALSIVSGNEDGSTTVKHCVIHHPVGRGYGFREDGAVFESIDELVCKHSKTTIKVYFTHMDTCLDRPVFGKRPTSFEELSDGNDLRDYVDTL